MELLVATLIGASIAIGAFIIANANRSRKLVADRVGNVSGMTFPYPVPVSANRKDEVTVNLKISKFEKEMFLAGLRNKRHMRLFLILRQASLAVPLVVALVCMALHNLTTAILIRAAIAGVFLYFLSVGSVVMIKRKRQAQILRALPQFLDLLVISVEAGMAFTAALERVIKESDAKEPLTREFSQMYHEFLGGLSLSEASDRMNKRCQVSDLAVMLAGLVQSDQMGASLGNTLRVQAVDLRDKYRQRLRTRAHKIPIKIIFPMLLSFGMIFFLTLGPAMYQLQYLLAHEAKETGASINEGVSTDSKVNANTSLPKVARSD